MAKQPPPLIQRKSKLEINVRNILNEQKSKLQQKQQLEHELLEDIKNYSKIRAGIEKDYGQALQKLSAQFSTKFLPKENDSEAKTMSRTPFGLWRKVLEETEKTATARITLSQNMLTNVTENVKVLKAARAVSTKTCNALAEKLQDELQLSVQELAKSEKFYIDMFKSTKQARDQSEDAIEKLKKGQLKLFQTKSNAERRLQKIQERMNTCEKRLAICRNDYLLNLAAVNAHHQRYYSTDLPELIALQDDNIYEKFKDYFKTLTTLETDVCLKSGEGMQHLRNESSQLQRAYAIQLFLRLNPVFTNCLNHEFQCCRGDKVRGLTQELSASHHLNKEARKWSLRLAKAQRIIRDKANQLHLLEKSSCQGDKASLADGSTDADNKDSIIGEIRQSEIIKVKAEARLDMLKEAGINVDEWLQSASADNGDFEDIADDQDEDQSDFGDEFDDWEDEDIGKADFSDDEDVSSSLQSNNKTLNAVAIYSFQAASREELSITENEELEILETDVDGWCKGRNKSGQCGYLPEAYIEVLKSDSKNRSAASSNSGSSCSGKKPVVAPKPVISIEPEGLFYAKAQYDYTAMEEEELSFKAGEVIKVTSVDNNGVDDGWWEGYLNGKKGAFPSIVVEKMQDMQPRNQNVAYERRRLNTDTFAGMQKKKGKRLVDRRASEF